MRHLSLSALVLLSSTAMGCGFLMPHSGAQPGSAQSAAAAYKVPEETKTLIRQREKTAYEASESAEDETIDRQEKEALKVLNRALGKVPNFPGGPMPESSSTALLALRKSPIKVRLEQVTDGDGKAVGDNFFQMKDSYTDRVQQLQRKLVEQKASKAEIKEIQDGSKYMMKVGDLSSAISSVSTQAYTSNFTVQSSGLQTMLKVAGMVRTRKMMEMDFDADDYARVKRNLERMRRVEAIAASTMGMLAAYQAVLNSGGDPKALDAIAENTVKAFPLKPTVTDDEAKKYVEDLKGNVAAQKSKYEQMMRKTYGDAKYEKSYKAGIDAMFKQAEDAQNQKSSGQMVADTQTKYKDDLRKCARGEKLDSGTMVGAANPERCRERLAQMGEPAPDAPATVAVPDAKSLVPGQVNQVNQGLGQVGQGLGVANAVKNGDVTGALDGAAKMFPADGTIGSSLAGLSALSKGDPKGALSAAMNLVPGGGLVKDGLSFAAGLLFGGSKKG